MKRIVIFLGICLILIGSSTPAEKITSFDTQPTPPPIITFPSCISIEYDEEYVNNTVFNPDNAYSIPVFIGYRVWVPVFFFNSFCYPVQVLKNWILFHSLIIPLLTINLSVEDAPSYIDIYPVSSNIVVCMSNDYLIVKGSVVIVIYNQAPPGPFTFCLRAEAPPVHRIQGYTTSTNITITVQ